MDTGRWAKASFAASVLMHALALALLALLGSRMPGVVEVFTVKLEGPLVVQSAAAPPKGEAEARPGAKRAPQKKRAAKPAAVAKKEPAAVERQTTKPQAKEAALEAPAPVKAAEPPAPAQAVEAAAQGGEAGINKGEDAPQDAFFVGGGAGAQGDSLLSYGVDTGSEGGSPGPAGGDSRAELIGRIRDAIERELTYPPIARKRRLEGTVVAAFVIDEGGQPRKIEVLRSSGHGILDRQVVKIIKRAAPFPYLPERVEVPIRFRLTRSAQ